LVAAKTPNIKRIQNLAGVDEDTLKEKCYNIKKKINRAKITLVEKRETLEKVLRAGKSGRKAPNEGTLLHYAYIYTPM